jgi:hypothetical protein
LKPGIRPIEMETPMYSFLLSAFVVLFLAVSLDRASSAAEPYRTPAHNYYQNNWMKSRG